jgi:peptide/nickel transport system substrate-binding protein
MLRSRIRGIGRGRGALGACCAAAGVAILVAACGPVSSSSSGSVGTTPTSGGLATYATLPGLNATYIFPFDGGANFNVTNAEDFQYLLYRPLYWFGEGIEPLLNQQESLAYPPKYNNQQVTITLKNYKWSNGDPVTAQDVMFWINMQIEDGIADWGGQVQGDFPFDVRDVHAVGTKEVTMTINGAYSEDWFTDNELSQITPLPNAWDRTASGQSDCDTSPAACTAVYNYLAGTKSSDAGAANPAVWGTSPIWSVVDGPWKVDSANSQGLVTMSLNQSYSGPLPAHHITKFELVPFTSEQAEFNVLQDPQSNNKIDVGYLPTVDAPVPPPGAQTGGNPVSLTGYNLSVLYPWQLSYFPYNYTDPTAGPIFKQKYFRQAFQLLVDQEGVIYGPMHGYGKPTIGPVDDYPVTPYMSRSLLAEGDMYELNPKKAQGLLQSHGWRIVPDGVDTCARPGSGNNQCGPGVAAGARLDFSMIYTSGVDWMYSGVKELESNASLVGIEIDAKPESIDEVTGTVFTCGSGCNTWQLAQWGQWAYSPDYLPTGEELFEPASIDDGGLYSSAEDNSLISKTLAAKTPSELNSAMWKWENYLAPQLPVVYEPDVATLIESADNLVIGSQSSTLTINPEDWYYLK